MNKFCYICFTVYLKNNLMHQGKTIGNIEINLIESTFIKSVFLIHNNETLFYLFIFLFFKFKQCPYIHIFLLNYSMFVIFLGHI